MNYACVENLQVFDEEGIPYEEGEVSAELSLNGFKNGIGVQGVQSKIGDDVEDNDHEDYEEKQEALRLAEAFDKLGCFCIDTPYKVLLCLRVSGTRPVQRITYDIRLGIRAKVQEKEPHGGYSSPSDYSGFSSIYSDDHSEEFPCDDCRKKCINPCCPRNPCGRLCNVRCETEEGPYGPAEKCILTNCATLREAFQASGAASGPNTPEQVSTVLDFKVPLCKECRSNLLTNAWCLSAQIVEPTDDPENGVIKRLVLQSNGLQDVEFEGSKFKRQLSVGQGVQAILRKIDNSHAFDLDSPNSGLGDLELAGEFSRFLYGLDDPLLATLTIFLNGTFNGTVLWTLRYATRALVPKKAPHSHGE